MISKIKDYQFIYEGQFLNGKIDGFGRLIWIDGSINQGFLTSKKPDDKNSIIMQFMIEKTEVYLVTKDFYD